MPVTMPFNLNPQPYTLRAGKIRGSADLLPLGDVSGAVLQSMWGFLNGCPERLWGHTSVYSERERDHYEDPVGFVWGLLYLFADKVT